MSESLISCPKCGNKFPLSDAWRQEIEATVRAKLDQETSEKQAKLFQKEQSLQEEKEKLYRDHQEKLDGVERQIAEQVRQKESILLERARGEVSLEMRDKENEIERLTARAKAAEEAELKLRQREREVSDREANVELDLTRRVSQERGKIEQAARTATEEQHRLELADKDKKIKDFEAQVEEMNRRLAQGSQQAQGEVLELELEEALAASFPLDRIEPIPKGKSGADLLQRVFAPSGHQSGTIVWEVKRTKSWSDNWISKLKGDLANMRGDLGVIATASLPEGVTSFTLIDGIFVVQANLAIPVASLLRAMVTEIALIRISSQGKNERTEALYNFLTGPGFRRRIEIIIHSFKELRGQLDAEKRAIQTQWSKREKLIRISFITSFLSCQALSPV